MFKKILEIFVKRVLWPLLKTIVELVLIQAAQWLFDKIRELTRKWRKEEEASAISEEERDSIRRKYERRESDIASVEREIPGKMREIVRDALHTADEQTHVLLENSPSVPISVPIPRATAKKPRPKEPKPPAKA